MSINVTVNSVVYPVPEEGEEDWGQAVTDLLVALSVIGSLTQSFANVVSVTTTPVTIVNGRTYLVNTSTAKTLTLPTAALNAFFIVRDVTGSAATNNITIARAGTESIEGVAANRVLAINNGYWLFVCDGTNWWQLSMNDTTQTDSIADHSDIVTSKASLTPAAPGDTATSLANRLSQIISQIKTITAEANWYSATGAMLRKSGGTMTGNIVYTDLIDGDGIDIATKIALWGG